MDAKAKKELKGTMLDTLTGLLEGEGMTVHRVPAGLAIEYTVEDETVVLVVDAVVKKDFDLDEQLQVMVEREAKAVAAAEAKATKEAEKAAKAAEKAAKEAAKETK